MTAIAKRMILGSVFVMIAVGMAGFCASADDGWVAGKIQDAIIFGDPIEGATASVLGGTASATTNASGSYNLTLPEGNYTIKVSAPGFKDKLSGTIRVTANNTTTYNTYLDKPSGNLTGTVTEDDGSPMIAANVSCCNRSTVTLFEGEYSLTGLPVGTWTLTITPILGTPMNFTVTIEDGKTTTKNAVIETPSPAIVSVKGPDGAPIANATVSFGNQSGTTDTDGSVTLNGLKPGSYTLKVSAKGFGTYSKTHTLDKGGDIFTVTLQKGSTGGGGKGLIPGFEAVGLLAVVPLAALVLRRRM